MEPDFSGWATVPDRQCTDGRTIKPDAFKHMDGMTVPLVWSHDHKTVDQVLGHALLEAKDGGLRAHGFFNDTPGGVTAKSLVAHKDVNSLSIWANKLVQRGMDVFHGMVREVSLVIAGANSGAKIDFINLAHGDGTFETLEDEAIIHSGSEIELPDASIVEHADAGSDPTAQEIYDSMTDVQKNLVAYMMASVIENNSGMGQSETSDENTNSETEDTLTHKEGNKEVTKNVFDQSEGGGTNTDVKHVLSPDDMRGIVETAKTRGHTLKTAVQDYCMQHGIEDMDILFPNAKNITGTPDFIKRRTEWVAGVIDGVSHTPFSRIKTLLADITQNEARAKGYIKGNLKKEEWFSVTKRTTGPTTVYKKQKLDRDDVLDLTDFDVVVWVKAEMRLMLEEEIATAILIGDGRAVDDDDKIKDPMGQQDGNGIRSILYDHEIYTDTINIQLSASNPDYNSVVEQVLLGRENMFGTGTPTMYTTRRNYNLMLLSKDTYGRRRYNNKAELVSALDVADIVPVDTMKREPTVFAILVNLTDYNVGADKGGEVNLFDFFDIDYNQMKYLIETRVSGALVRYKAAQVIRLVDPAWTEVTPAAPTFVDSTGVVTIVATTHITYKDLDTGATLSTGDQTALDPGKTLNVVAVPATGYFVAGTTASTWSFTRPHA